MRLAEKIVAPRPPKGNRIKRHYDQPQTPFDRLCTTTQLDEAVKVQLQCQRQATNPRLLRQEIYDGLWQLSRLPTADPTQGQDVYQTLLPKVEADVEQVLAPQRPLLATL